MHTDHLGDDGAAVDDWFLCTILFYDKYGTFIDYYVRLFSIKMDIHLIRYSDVPAIILFIFIGLSDWCADAYCCFENKIITFGKLSD